MATKYCPGCSTELPTSDFHKDKRTATGYRCWCKACVRSRFLVFKEKGRYTDRLAKYAAKRKEARTHTPETVWAMDTFHNAKKRARTQGLEFDLTKEWLLAQLGGICPLLGTAFSYGTGKTTAATPTVDRKDPSKGYIQTNCWVVSAKANRIKTDASTDEIERVLVGLRAAGV